MSNIRRTGYRFINLSNLQKRVSEISLHVCICPAAISVAASGKSPVKLMTEIRSLGLVSILEAECCACNENLYWIPKLANSKRYDLNVRAVWGSMATGNGPTHLNEFLGTLNSPGLSQSSFSNFKQQISDWWLATFEDDMLAAGAEERRMAIEKGHYHQEVPSITVISDGG